MKPSKWIFPCFAAVLAGCQTPRIAPRAPVVQVFELTGGGYSGLAYEGTRGDELVFRTLTDRGPNLESVEKSGRVVRPFQSPGFHPYWVRLTVNPRAGIARVDSKSEWKNAQGRPLSGLPPRQGPGDEIPTDARGRPLKVTPDGIDAEGLALDADGTVWVGEEYLPSVLHFSKDSRLISRWDPGSAAVPSAYGRRKMNRGFEAIVTTNDAVYAFLQSPLPGESLGRILKITKDGRAAGEFGYPFETAASGAPAVDKIGDACALPDGRMLVIEQNGAKGEKAFRRVFAVSFAGASGGPLALVEKKLVADLAALGLADLEKAEGLACVGPDSFAVVNDNDFDVAGTGAPSRLFLITTAPF